MKITSRMLPFEVVHAVKDDVEAQVSSDRRELDALRKTNRGVTHADWFAAILEYGAEDRERVNQAIARGRISQGTCYRDCHHCCKMSSRYDVETFDILLSYQFNRAAVNRAYQTGKLDDNKQWCGLLEDGLCSIHRYKPYTCLLTAPSPKGAEKGGCYFTGDGNAQTTVHTYTMVVVGRMRKLFREYLPEVPEFAGHNINQAFQWAGRHYGAKTERSEPNRTISFTSQDSGFVHLGRFSRGRKTGVWEKSRRTVTGNDERDLLM